MGFELENESNFYFWTMDKGSMLFQFDKMQEFYMVCIDINSSCNPIIFVVMQSIQSINILEKFFSI